MNTPPQQQQGGYVKPMLLPDIIIGLLYAVGIAYVDSIPSKFLKAADSFLGRVAMFVVILGFAVSGKWILGLLATIFALRLMRYDSTVGSVEGFISTFGGNYPSSGNYQNEGFLEQIVTKVEKRDNDKWFVEEVLDEKPTIIEEKIIETQSV
jgi:fumarate reductase subunit D